MPMRREGKYHNSSSSWRSQIRPAREMKSFSPAPALAVELGCQGSADRPHIFSCSFVKNMLRGLVFLSTGEGWRGCLLQFAVHMTVQSVVSGTKPHQNDLLLPGQQVIVIPLWPWHHGRSDESSPPPPPPEVDFVFKLFSFRTLLCKDVRSLISW